MLACSNVSMQECSLHPYSSQNRSVSKGCTDLPLRSDVNLDVGSAGGLVVEELGLLDERGVGKSQEPLFDTLRRIANVDNEVNILGAM